MALLKKIFIIFSVLFAFFALSTATYAADICEGYLQNDPTHSIQSGICYYETVSGTSPKYTTESSNACTISCNDPLPDCSEMTANDYHHDSKYHGISDSVRSCPIQLGGVYKCCAPDVQPSPTYPPPPCTGGGKDNTTCVSVNTALGSISTDPSSLVGTIVGILLGVAGGIATVIIIISGYRIVFSQGDPEKLKGAQEAITSAIIGLLFIIFSIVILRIIGVDILHIPGLNP